MRLKVEEVGQKGVVRAIRSALLESLKHLGLAYCCSFFSPWFWVFSLFRPHEGMLLIDTMRQVPALRGKTKRRSEKKREESDRERTRRRRRRHRRRRRCSDDVGRISETLSPYLVLVQQQGPVDQRAGQRAQRHGPVGGLRRRRKGVGRGLFDERFFVFSTSS